MTNDQERDDEGPDRGDVEGAGGSGLAESVTASNAETVLDPDAEPRQPEEEVADTVDRLERHSHERPGSPSGEDARPAAET